MFKINLSEISLSVKKSSLIDIPRKVKTLPKWSYGIYIFLITISICSWLYYHYTGLTLSYNDARSHLDVARRVVDSLTPGIVQIGSVWLPFYHLLELLTIWNDFMFRTGLSGSIISMIAFVGSSILLMKLVRLFYFSVAALISALAVFCLNPNLLFLQSVPMTESLLLFTILGAIYFFAKWVQTDKLLSLVISAGFVFCSVLTRYDGWFMLLFLCGAVPIVSMMRNGKRHAEGDFLLFATLGFFAVGLWFAWNPIIFGDALYFMNSQYSAKAQQDILFDHGQLLTKGNMLYSIQVYITAVASNIGIAVTIIGFIGLLLFSFSRIKLAIKLVVFSLIAPIIFNILSLYLGQSVIHLPQLPPYNWFNIRYGIMALPAIAVGIGYIGSKHKILAVLLVILALGQYAWMYKANDIITVQDGIKGSSGYFLDDIGKWIHNNADSGLILVAASSQDALIFASDLPLKRFITEGSGKYWKTSLKDPTVYASYIIMHDGDLVSEKVKGKPIFVNNYKLVYKGNFSNVYKRNW